jgi:hypothetical protein
MCGQVEGRAMAQAVICWPLTAEAWVRARVNPCGICCGQSGTVKQKQSRYTPWRRLGGEEV